MLYGKAMALNAIGVSYAFLLSKSKNLTSVVGIAVTLFISNGVFGQCINGSINIGSNVGLPNSSQVPINTMGQINNNKFYCVNGNFEFNANTVQTFINCNFYITPGSKITVNGLVGTGNPNLAFVNCRFQPSGTPNSRKYWRGFEFKGQVNIEITGCEILGAEFGTHIDIHRNSVLNITTTRFRENVLGCVIRGSIPAKLKLDNNLFTTIDFESFSQYPGQTNPTWIPNFSQNKFMRGYDIQARGEVIINKNRFSSLKNGIFSLFAEVHILENVFNNLKFDANGTNAKGIEVYKSNDLRIERCKWDNVDFIAFASDCYTLCQNNTVIKGMSGFEFINCNDRVVIVKDNPRIEVGNVGITVKNSKNIGLVINNNQIFVENNDTWGINRVPDGGIYLENVIASTLPWVYSDIFANNIYLNNQGNRAYGIQGIKMSGFYVHYNNVFNAMVHTDFEPGGQLLNEVKGFNLNQTSNNHFLGNLLERTVQATCGGPMSSTGIKTNMSTNDKYCRNNTIRRFETGTQFSGPHEKLCFSQTIFENNCIGLEYTLNTTTNDQRLAGNQWYGTFGINRAINSNFQNVIGKYYVSTNQLPLFPIGFSPPGWFNVIPGASESDQCCTIEALFDNKDILVSKNLLYPQSGMEGYRWETEKQLYNKLSQSQLPPDSAYQAFWAYQLNTPIAFYSQLEKNTDALYNCELNDNLRKRELRELIFNQESRKMILVEQLELAEPGSQSEAILISELNLINDSLANESDELNLLHSNCLLQAQLKANQILTQLQSIVPTSIPQITQHNVYRIYLSRIAENRELFTEAEMQTLIPIAMACERTHGKSVTLAGIMIRVNDSESSIESECPALNPEGLSRKIELSDLSAVPNPSQDGLITLRLPSLENKSGWTVRVLDLHGKLHQEFFVEKGIEQYPLNLPNPGLWIVQAVNPTGMSRSIKVIFN